MNTNGFYQEIYSQLGIERIPILEDVKDDEEDKSSTPLTAFQLPTNDLAVMVYGHSFPSESCSGYDIDNRLYNVIDV